VAVADARETTGTVARVALLLRCLAEGDGPQTVAALAERMDLPRSTVHRLLNLLRAEDFVAAGDGTRRYAPGPELYRVAALVTAQRDVPALAGPIMRRVVEACNETCLLGLLLPAQGRMMFAAEVPSGHPLGYRIDLLVPLSLAWGASGRAILAFLDPERIEAVLAAEGPSPVTGASLPPREELLADLARVRDEGYAYTRGQKIPDSRGIAAPVFSADGRVTASLCLTIPELRFDTAQQPALAALVRDGARELSELLGARPAP